MSFFFSDGCISKLALNCKATLINKNPVPWKSLLEYKYQTKLTNKFELWCITEEAVFNKDSCSLLISLTCQSYWRSFLGTLSYHRYQGDTWQPGSNPLCFLREVAISLIQKWRYIFVLVCVSISVTRATVTWEEPISGTLLYFITKGLQASQRDQAVVASGPAYPFHASGFQWLLLMATPMKQKTTGKVTDKSSVLWGWGRGEGTCPYWFWRCASKSMKASFILELVNSWMFFTADYAKGDRVMHA